MCRDVQYTELMTKDPKIPWQYLVVVLRCMSRERSDGLKILKKKIFFGLGKYHPTPDTGIQGFVKVQRLKKKPFS